MRKIMIALSALTLMGAPMAMAGAYNVDYEAGVKVFRGVPAGPDTQTLLELAKMDQQRELAMAKIEAETQQNQREMEQSLQIAKLSGTVDAMQKEENRRSRRYNRGYQGYGYIAPYGGYYGGYYNVPPRRPYRPYRPPNYPHIPVTPYGR